ncbi:Two-component response regulator ARR10 [Striga hermonthica]|uniref:Two-component response regulator ARR10 n=1 Tax=Striga hermonthica TaxID=68872 RepID=A0A9N7N5Q0_STRHE|nr:Two-component response regulator ARR10 [Striga hermonthica]
MLSQGSSKFNVVMVDVEPSNLDGFKLVHEAVSLNLPVIVMSINANPILAKCAIEDGAFLFMQNPPSHDELKYLWQHLLRETTARKNNEKGKSRVETSTHKGENSSMNKVTGQGSGIKPKMCTEWTLELHEKFITAVKILGDGRCFPKDILELMNVPGLTRMQVASHLQKCRHGWQPSDGRRQKAPKPANPNQNRPKKYGIFPRLARGTQPQIPPNNDQNVEIASDINMESSTMMMPDLLQGSQSTGVQGIWVDVTTCPNNSNNSTNEIFSNENVVNIEENSFDYAAAGEDVLIPNNFSLNQFDWDNVFWNSWGSNFSKEL